MSCIYYNTKFSRLSRRNKSVTKKYRAKNGGYLSDQQNKFTVRFMNELFGRLLKKCRKAHSGKAFRLFKKGSRCKIILSRLPLGTKFYNEKTADKNPPF